MAALDGLIVNECMVLGVRISFANCNKLQILLLNFELELLMWEPKSFNFMETSPSGLHSLIRIDYC